MRRFLLALAFCGLSSAAFAQVYPSPRFGNVNVSSGGSYQINGTSVVSLPLVKFAGVDPTGATDSSAGVQAAVTAALALTSGATIKIPAGTYKIAAQVSIPKTSGKSVTFDCDAGATFNADGVFGAAMFSVGSGVGAGGAGFTSIGCTYTGANTTNTRAFALTNANAAVFRGNTFRSMYLPVDMASSFAVEFDGNTFDTNTVYSIHSSTAAHHLFLHGNKFYNTGTSGTYTVLLDAATDNLIVRDNDAETGWTFLGMGAGGSALTLEGNYIETFSNTPWFFTAAVKGASIRQNWVALSGTLTLGNITGGSYVNNSSFNQTVAVNTGTATDLQWSGNSLTGTGSLAYSGTIILGSQNLASGSSYQINGRSVLTGNVQGTGFPGMDNVPGSWMLYANGTNADSLLRVQRVGPVSGGSGASTYKGIWGLTYSGKSNAGYEWAITGEVHNTTLATTGAQNVAVNGTIFKEVNGTGPVGPSWGGNFNCTDTTGENNPVAGCIGSEIDVAIQTGSATTDTGRQRVGMQIAASATTAGTHIGRGVLVNTDANATIDRVFDFSGNFSKGLDATAGTWSVAPIFLGPDQKIVLDGNTAGVSNRSLFYSSGSLIYATQNGNVFSVDDDGGVLLSSAMKLKKLAVASLPTCNAGAEGYLYAVTDANSTTFNAAVAGGGANHVMAFCNGTGWTVH